MFLAERWVNGKGFSCEFQGNGHIDEGLCGYGRRTDRLTRPCVFMSRGRTRAYICMRQKDRLMDEVVCVKGVRTDR